jgi:hypothetical protein
LVAVAQRPEQPALAVPPAPALARVLQLPLAQMEIPPTFPKSRRSLGFSCQIAFQTGFQTGFRIDLLFLTLMWSDVDFAASVMTV